MKNEGIRMFLKKVNTIVYFFEIIILAYSTIFLTILMSANVIGRMFGESITWAEEIAQLQIFMITFIGISYGARKARHIRMGAILELLNIKVKKVMAVITSAGTMLIMFLLSYHGMVYTLNVMKSGRVTPSLLWPYWVFLVWAPIGFFLGGIQYLRTIIKNFTEEDVWWSAEEKSEFVEVEPVAENEIKSL